MELEIKETGSTAQATVLKTTAKALAIALSQVPIQIQYSEPVATPVAKLTKQTGTHSISTSNGFAGNDNIDAILANLANFGIEVSIDNDVMIFKNTTSQDIQISLQAQGRSGKQYVEIEQENTSIVIDGKNVSFTLKAQENLSGFRIRIKDLTLSKSEQYLTYRPESVGTNGEKVINLANLFDTTDVGNDGWSSWSRELTFSDVNHVMTNGGLTVVFSNDHQPNYWINMSNINSLTDFFNELKNQMYSSSQGQLEVLGQETSSEPSYPQPEPSSPEPPVMPEPDYPARDF